MSSSPSRRRARGARSRAPSTRAATAARRARSRGSRRAPTSRRVAFLEVDPGAARSRCADFAARYGGEPVFDYVWYTPKASDEDSCERMRKHKMR